MAYLACNLCGKSWPDDYQDGYCGKCIHVRHEHLELLSKIREQETTIQKIRNEGFSLLTKYASELVNENNEEIAVKKSDLINVWYALQLRYFKIEEPYDFLQDCLKKGRVIIEACNLFKSNIPQNRYGKSGIRHLYDACIEYLKKYGEEENKKWPLDKVPD